MIQDDNTESYSKARDDIRRKINMIPEMIKDFDPSPWTSPNVIRPLKGRQEEFITSKAQITWYGGSAGSAKTEGIVLDQLKHINDPNFESVTFRRNTKSLKGAGGIYNKAGKVYKKLGAKERINDMTYVWPSGAKSRYCHLEYNERTADADHQGLEYTGIYFDELGKFSKAAFLYFLTRMRSNADIQSYIKATCNPEFRESEGGWMHEFLQGFYLDDYGYPIEERSGVIRWFITDEDGTIIWGDSKEELIIKYGDHVEPFSFTFISAQIYDNLVLCKLKPSYLAALKNAPRTERERLLYSCWNVSAKGSGYFQKDFVEFVDRSQIPKMKRVIRAYDLAASVKSEINTDPDWTACVKMGLGEDGYIYILDAKDLLARPAGVSKFILDNASFDGKRIPVGLPLDSGAGGVIQFEHYSKPLILSGYKVKRFKTRKGKLERFSGFSNAAENGIVKVLKGLWNDKYISQLENFDPERKRQHDD